MDKMRPFPVCSIMAHALSSLTWAIARTEVRCSHLSYCFLEPNLQWLVETRFDPKDGDEIFAPYSDDEELSGDEVDEELSNDEELDSEEELGSDE
jgi:hypothetical protein